MRSKRERGATARSRSELPEENGEKPSGCSDDTGDRCPPDHDHYTPLATFLTDVLRQFLDPLSGEKVLSGNLAFLSEVFFIG